MTTMSILTCKEAAATIWKTGETVKLPGDIKTSALSVQGNSKQSNVRQWSGPVRSGLSLMMVARLCIALCIATACRERCRDIG